MEYDFVAVEFDREMIESGSISELFPSGEILVHFGKQLWTVSGYDDTPDEIFQILAVRRYFQQLHKSYPGWIALLNFERPDNLSILLCLLSVAPHRTPDGQLSFDLSELKEVLRFDMEACSRFIESGLVSDEVMQKQLSDLLSYLP
jgi:hypothetical protein